MLPDFPELKEKLEKGVYIYLGIVANQGIMSEMRRETHLEGNRVGNQSEEGNIELSDYKVIRAESCVSRADVITKGPIAFIQNAQNMAEQIRKQQIEMLINKLQEATAKTGNIIDGKGQPITFDAYLEGLKLVRMEFDEQGRPYTLCCLTSPEMGAALQKKLPEWLNDPDNRQRYENMITEKRKEWNDRESHRKLVD